MFFGVLKHVVDNVEIRYEVVPRRVIFLVSPKGHPIDTLNKFKNEPYIHSPLTEI